MASTLRLLLVCSLSLPALLSAQATGTGNITGVVRDSAGLGVAGAELSIEPARKTATTDDRGVFRLDAVPSGTVSLRARRLGFRPLQVEVVLEPGTTRSIAITVARVAQELSPVVVRGARRRNTGEFGGFYDRRGMGFGHYITREQIERRNPSYMTDMFRTIPSVRIVATRFARNAVRVRGASVNCPPQVWMDGLRLGATEYDIDFLDPRSVEGIEIYTTSTVPAEFMVGPDVRACGTLVVWTRRGERRPRGQGVTAAELASLVASLQVYTADQVDVSARPDSSAPVRPVYPDSLYRAHIGGEAVVEFVVDTTGSVETETFGVVSATHPLFTAAVRRAVETARFFPAQLGGRRVRQVVQQPFQFVIGEAK